MIDINWPQSWIEFDLNSMFHCRGSTCHVLLTCCKDNVCRLWAETLLPSDSLLSGEGYTQWSESVTASSNLKRNISSREKVQCNWTEECYNDQDNLKGKQHLYNLLIPNVKHWENKNSWTVFGSWIELYCSFIVEYWTISNRQEEVIWPCCTYWVFTKSTRCTWTP